MAHSRVLRRPLSLIALLFAGAGLATACQSGGDRMASTGQAVSETAEAVGGSVLPRLPLLADAAKPDSGPPLVVRREGHGMRLTVDARDGDQIKALQPPYLEMSDGRRLAFEGPAVTDDSAYFVGPVSAHVGDSVLPLRGTLHTSYCRAGEHLCRSAKRTVHVTN